MGFYVTPDQVRAAVDPNALLQLCDAVKEVGDSNPALQAAMQRAHSEVTSNLTVEWSTLPPELPGGPIPTIVQNAELAYVEYFLYRRKPALAAKISPTFLDGLLKDAKDRMKALKTAEQEIAPTDNPPPSPPANLGGVTVDNGPNMLSRSSANLGIAGGGGPNNSGPSDFGDFAIVTLGVLVREDGRILV